MDGERDIREGERLERVKRKNERGGRASRGGPCVHTNTPPKIPPKALYSSSLFTFLLALVSLDKKTI